MFFACEKGFQLTFKNGLTISIMFGKGNYCERRYEENQTPQISETAEIAVFRGEENVFVDGRGCNIGWKSTKQVAKAIEFVSETCWEETSSDYIRSKLNEILEN